MREREGRRKKSEPFHSVKEHSRGAGDSLCSQKTSIGICGCVLAYVRSSQSYFYVVRLNGYFLIPRWTTFGRKLSTSIICQPREGKYRRNNSSRVRDFVRARLEFMTRDMNLEEGGRRKREKERWPVRFRTIFRTISFRICDSTTGTS